MEKERKKETGTHVHNEPAAWKRKERRGKKKEKNERPSKLIKREEA
jgi:hypothetical protein